MVPARPTSLISGDTSWLTETWVKPSSRARAASGAFVLGKAIAVHQGDGDRGEAPGAMAARASRSGVEIQRPIDLAVGQHPLVHLQHRVIERGGLDDPAGEDVGARLRPMRRLSRNPRVTTNRVGSPLRSKRALVATVVPIRTSPITPAGIRSPGFSPRWSRTP